FGPLHFYHLQRIGDHPAHAWIFAAIFAIGLFFGILFRRSGNLWIVGIFHGVGDWYLTGLQQVVSTN
ncbi:MAG TPA: CPBP family glutamic-type intramembrane protease, partial [Cyclobacteriaceae bacterium]|nr:CPBP family glutamic-type intramembrane protease [Cyclobacteriaceae bacterium]